MPEAPKISVLIVDDHPVVRAGLRDMLSGEGDIEVVGEAGDGSEALESARRLRPDVVLLDVQLPDMDGFEIAALLGTNGDRPQIILTSSRDAAEFGGLIERSPALGFVPKGELSGGRLAELLE